MRQWRACVVGAALLAGCGGGSGGSEHPLPRPTGSDRDQIAQTVRGYLKALADSDASIACQELTVIAQQDLATMAGGGQSCEDGAAALSRQVRDSDRRGLRAAKVFDERIHGAKATAKVTGNGSSPRQLPLAKEGGRWKIAGFEGNVHFTSQAEAACIAGALQAYDDHKSPKFWYREGRNDFRDYIVAVCRRAAERNLLKQNVTRAQLAPIAREVMREMRRRGQIR
jgi:hypothetical protein